MGWPQTFSIWIQLGLDTLRDATARSDSKQKRQGSDGRNAHKQGLEPVPRLTRDKTVTRRLWVKLAGHTNGNFNVKN